MKEHLLDEEDEFEMAMKVIIVGNGSVGKSSMIQRFCRGVFTRDYKKTIGVDFLERVLSINGQSVRLMLWDTAGQEEFDAITRTYYRGASACVLTCSITDKNSFNALPVWKTKVCRECGDDVPMILVANKYDLQKQAVIDSSSLEEMARSLGITKVFRTSVKEDMNILAVFTNLAQDYFASVIAMDERKNSTELIEGDPFRNNFESQSLVVEDKPHHKFHTPVFGHFRTSDINNLPKNNLKNNNPKKNKIKIIPNKESGYQNKQTKSLLSSFQNPVIIKGQRAETIQPMKGFMALPTGSSKILNCRKMGQKDSPYYFSTNGNHYTHWENMPFRLDVGNGTYHFRKPKKDLCSIL